MTREERLARALVELADTLVDDFDLVELLTLLVEHSVGLIASGAAGVVLRDEQGVLRFMAATSEAVELVELFQVQNDQGPCLECSRTGEPVIADNLAVAGTRWPAFIPFALAQGFQAAHAFPLRLRGRVLGALNLFAKSPGPLAPADIAAAQALADVATIAILQLRASRDAQVLTDQLQQALDSRVVIEQAKGMLAERAGIGLDAAFARLRGYARDQQRRLADVSAEVVNGTLSATAVGPREAERPRM
jgi:GAF domain-containing protein